MKKLYIVRLSLEERERLETLVNKGRVAADKRKRAQVLLLVDQGEDGPGQSDGEAAERAGVSRRMVETVRRRCVLEGLDTVLERRARRRDLGRGRAPVGGGGFSRCATHHPGDGQPQHTRVRRCTRHFRRTGRAAC